MLAPSPGGGHEDPAGEVRAAPAPRAGDGPAVAAGSGGGGGHLGRRSTPPSDSAAVRTRGAVDDLGEQPAFWASVPNSAIGWAPRAIVASTGTGATAAHLPADEPRPAGAVAPPPTAWCRHRPSRSAWPARPTRRRRTSRCPPPALSLGRQLLGEDLGCEVPDRRLLLGECEVHRVLLHAGHAGHAEVEHGDQVALISVTPPPKVRIRLPWAPVEAAGERGGRRAGLQRRGLPDDSIRRR